MKHHTHAIYQRGKAHAQNSCNTEDDGTIRANFTTLTGQEYCDEKNAGRAPDEPEYELMTWDKAMPLIHAAQEAAYVTGWKEISKQAWWDALEVLPPEKHGTVAGVELFRMCEYLTGNITAHFARLEDRYFVRNCRTTEKPETLAAEIAEFCATPPETGYSLPQYNPQEDGEYSAWLVSNNID
jgi:hypothetical protein